MTEKDKSRLLERLDYLQGKMEHACDDPQFLKELSREYKSITKQLFPKTKEYELPAKKVKESRQQALEKIKEILDKGEVEEQFKNKSGDYYSNDKFIVSYNVNYSGFPHEVSIDLDNSFSNVRCIKVRRSLVSEQELDAFRSIEYALIKEGLSLIKNKEQKIEFFNKYAKPYNEKIKNEHGK